MRAVSTEQRKQNSNTQPPKAVFSSGFAIHITENTGSNKINPISLVIIHPIRND